MALTLGTASGVGAPPTSAATLRRPEDDLNQLENRRSGNSRSVRMRTPTGWSTSRILVGTGFIAAILALPAFMAAQSYVFSSASFPTGLRPNFVATGDLNGDGIQDVVVVNQCGSDPTCSSSGSVSVLLGKPDGTFQPHVDYPVGSD